MLRDRVTAEFREHAIRRAAYAALLVSLGSLLRTLKIALEEQYADSLMVAEGALRQIANDNFVGQTYEEDGDKEKVLDIERSVKHLIDDRVAAISEQKRKQLIMLLGTVPALLLPRGRGGSEPDIDATDEQCISLARNYPAMLKRWQGFKNQLKQVNWRNTLSSISPTLLTTF